MRNHVVTLMLSGNIQPAPSNSFSSTCQLLPHVMNWLLFASVCTKPGKAWCIFNKETESKITYGEKSLNYLKISHCWERQNLVASEFFLYRFIWYSLCIGTSSQWLVFSNDRLTDEDFLSENGHYLTSSFHI